MTRALYNGSAAYRQALAEVDEHMAAHLRRSVVEIALGDSEAVHRTEFAQPVIFAVEYALARVLTRVGVEPSWLIGHSVGEFAAAAVAGVFDLDDACRLVTARGRLIQQLPGSGAMLAVRSTLDSVAELLAAEPQVTPAAINGPQEVVLSGAADAIGRIEAVLTDRGVTVRPPALR